MSQSIFKNYIIALSSPTVWIGILLFLGLILLSTKRKKIAKILLICCMSIFFLFGFDPVTEFLLDGMENKYPGFTVQDHMPVDKIKYVAVLGAGYIQEPPTHPLTTRLGTHGTVRVVEGIRIYRELPGSKLILSGKGWADITEAEAMKKLAISLGVNSDDIIVDNESNNTYEHTENLKPILKDQPFVMVTSALHMRRAMGTFMKAGLNPIPAPTDHILTGKYALFNMKVPLPTGDNLRAVDLVFNEYAGIFLYMVKGKM